MTTKPFLIGNRRSLTWVAVCVYLAIRIGLVSVSRVITHFHPPIWVDPIYQLSAYILVVFLVCINLNELVTYNIDRFALFLLVVGAPLNTILTKLNLPFPVNSKMTLFLLYLPLAIFFLTFVLNRKSIIQSLRMPRLFHIFLAVLVGLAAAAVTGLLIRSTQSTFFPQHLSITQLLLLPVQQYSYAAVTEEPFFRGFLWGLMKQSGFKDRSVFITQAVLFWIAHIYYINIYPISFWVIVPLGAIVFGLLIWNSKSLSTSLIAHGLMNGVGQAIAYYTI
jgi:membrane protease YdiL (CAAX protease family)